MTRLGVFRLFALVAGRSWPGATGKGPWLPIKKFVTKDGKRPSGLVCARASCIGLKTLYIAGKGDYKPKEDTAGKRLRIAWARSAKP